MVKCQLNDFCIIEEIHCLLSQRNALKHTSSKMRKEFENLLIKYPEDNLKSESTVMCFHNFLNRIVECTTSDDAACFIEIPYGSLEISAGCAQIISID